MTTINVIGCGFVGGSLATVMAERGFTVWAYDIVQKCPPGAKKPSFHGKYPKSIDEFRQSTEDNSHSNVYFVCLPTPMREDGSCDTSIVDGVLDELSKINGNRIAVVKSTVPPGTTEKWNKRYEGTGLRVVFSPEFLREVSALEDMRNQDRIILGGPKLSVNKIRDLFRTAFPDVDIHKTSSTNAELVKYTINNFLSVKVSFANEINQICDKLASSGQDADYDRVIELAMLDKRLGSSHWKVPGPMPADDGTGRLLPGFAGSCFIKDINAMMFVAKSLGVDPKVLNGAWQKNLEVRPERDWEKLVGRAVSRTEIVAGKNEWIVPEFIPSNQKEADDMLAYCNEKLIGLLPAGCNYAIDEAIDPLKKGLKTGKLSIIVRGSKASDMKNLEFDWMSEKHFFRYRR